MSLLMLCMLGPRHQALGQTLLEILNADRTAYDDLRIGKDATKLIGRVSLKHEDVVMTCDSAYYYRATSSVDAFSNVRVVQGDTLTLTSDLAHYDGIRRLARVRNNVKMVSKEYTLLTDSLNYDREAGIAYYMGG